MNLKKVSLVFVGLVAVPGFAATEFFTPLFGFATVDGDADVSVALGSAETTFAVGAEPLAARTLQLEAAANTTLAFENPISVTSGNFTINTPGVGKVVLNGEIAPQDGNTRLYKTGSGSLNLGSLPEAAKVKVAEGTLGLRGTAKASQLVHRWSFNGSLSDSVGLCDLFRGGCSRHADEQSQGYGLPSQHLRRRGEDRSGRSCALPPLMEGSQGKRTEGRDENETV